MNICVFGAARDEIGENFMALGTALGRELAARGHTLVFGAGGHGMMGAAARGAYEMGGKIIGVVPESHGYYYSMTAREYLEYFSALFDAKADSQSSAFPQRECARR